MPQLTQAEIRNNAVAFVNEWKNETRERAESQSFWNEFLEVFGVKRRKFFLEESTNESGADLGPMLGMLFQLLDKAKPA